jgi:hypothetical protein
MTGRLKKQEALSLLVARPISTRAFANSSHLKVSSLAGSCAPNLAETSISLFAALAILAALAFHIVRDLPVCAPRGEAADPGSVIRRAVLDIRWSGHQFWRGMFSELGMRWRGRVGPIPVRGR